MQDTSPTAGSPQARGRLAQFGVGIAAVGWSAGAVAASVAAEHRLAAGLDGTGQAITLATSFLLWPLLLLAGWAWSNWQRRLATIALSRAPVADPRWQAEAHWATGRQWWVPRRHLIELATVLDGPDVRLVKAWWASWIGFRCAAYLVIWQLWAPPGLTLPGWATWPAIAVQGAAAALAILLIGRLSRAAAAVPVTSPDRWCEPGPGPRTGLLVELGVLFRLVTPGFVLGAFTILAALIQR